MRMRAISKGATIVHHEKLEGVFGIGASGHGIMMRRRAEGLARQPAQIQMVHLMVRHELLLIIVVQLRQMAQMVARQIVQAARLAQQARGIQGRAARHHRGRGIGEALLLDVLLAIQSTGGAGLASSIAVHEFVQLLVVSTTRAIDDVLRDGEAGHGWCVWLTRRRAGLWRRQGRGAWFGGRRA